jgi:hypothetical protein
MGATFGMHPPVWTAFPTRPMTALEPRPAQPSSRQDPSGVVCGAGGFWVLMLLAIAFYALFWRVDNEPGARPVPGLL